MVSETPLGAEGLVQSKLVPKLVTLLPGELDEIKILILDELHFCMSIDTTDALDTEGMEIHTELLSHENPEIRGRAARNIMDLRFDKRKFHPRLYFWNITKLGFLTLSLPAYSNMAALKYK